MKWYYLSNNVEKGSPLEVYYVKYYLSLYLKWQSSCLELLLFNRWSIYGQFFFIEFKCSPYLLDWFVNKPKSRHYVLSFPELTRSLIRRNDENLSRNACLQIWGERGGYEENGDEVWIISTNGGLGGWCYVRENVLPPQTGSSDELRRLENILKKHSRAGFESGSLHIPSGPTHFNQGISESSRKPHVQSLPGWTVWVRRQTRRQRTGQT